MLEFHCPIVFIDAGWCDKPNIEGGGGAVVSDEGGSDVGGMHVPLVPDACGVPKTATCHPPLLSPSFSASLTQPSARLLGSISL